MPIGIGTGGAFCRTGENAALPMRQRPSFLYGDRRH